MWLIWSLTALFAAEWIALWATLRIVPEEKLPTVVLAVATATIAAGWVVVYIRVQRRKP